MIVVTLSRKPIKASTTDCVLRSGCGALNIGASRIGNAKRTYKGSGISQQRYTDGRAGLTDGRGRDNEYNVEGRWPSNLLLSHHPNCVLRGVKQVKGHKGYPNGPGGVWKKEYQEKSAIAKSWNQLSTKADNEPWKGHADGNGMETVQDWECGECSVSALDTQSGIKTTVSNYSYKRTGQEFVGSIPSQTSQSHWHTEHGGASRYFKQFKNEVNMQTQIPQEMLDYLLTMITPPPHVEPNVIVIEDLSTMDFEPIDDDSVHGVIAFGIPTPEQSSALLRIMKEGAHVMCVSPKDNPGHHTACNLEEGGFEIRDAILYLDQPDGFYYVPKPSRREREEGTGTLKTQTGAQAVGRKEGSKGLDNPRAGAGRTANEIANVHPTVKPIDLMLKLIEDLPEHLQGETVVDPFLGSGTTGIAAVKGGYNFIGVEREEQYLAIADARINHHATAQWRGFTVEITSELIKPEPEPQKELSLEDMFWSTWGEP